MSNTDCTAKIKTLPKHHILDWPVYCQFIASRPACNSPDIVCPYQSLLGMTVYKVVSEQDGSKHLYRTGTEMRSSYHTGYSQSSAQDQN